VIRSLGVASVLNMLEQESVRYIMAIFVLTPISICSWTLENLYILVLPLQSNVNPLIPAGVAQRMRYLATFL